MNASEREIAELAQQPTAERVQALNCIIRRQDIQAVLRAPGQDQRRCRRLSDWMRPTQSSFAVV